MRRINRQVMAWLLTLVVLASCSATWGQSFSQRIADYHKRQQRRQEADKGSRDRVQANILARRLSKVIGPIQFKATPSRDAFAWWAKATDVQLIINWQAFANEGIDPETPINLKLKLADATTVLRLLMQQTAQNEQPLIYEVTPWYIRIITRSAALRRPVTRVYYIGDLLLRIPSFSNARSVGTDSSSDDDDDDDSSNNDGGDDDDDSQGSLSTIERAERIAQLIRDAIEPDIWVANGGEHASISYFQQKLVVRAPMFVHRQIGGVTRSPIGRSRTAGSRSGVVRPVRTRRGFRPAMRNNRSTGVSGVQVGESSPVSGVQDSK